jgi:hypothetical protein
VKPRSSVDLTGEDLRRARTRCGYDLASVAVELGVAPGDLRALEWDRPDLLGERRAARLRRRYLDWLQPEGIPRPIAPRTQQMGPPGLEPGTNRL